MAAPETEARAALKSLIESAFSAEGFTVANDHLHESLGNKGTRIGVSPNRSSPTSSNNFVLEMQIFVQFYAKYKLEIDPLQSVDPATIEGYAERFREALRTGDPNTSRVWYFQLTNLNYPLDPTGNKTRFEATVVARGNNTALLESSA